MSDEGGDGSGRRLRRSLVTQTHNGAPKFLKMAADERVSRPAESSSMMLKEEPLVEYANGDGPQSERKTKRASVIFFGCDYDFWSRMRRRLMAEGLRLRRTSEFAEFTQLLNESAGPVVVVLGSELGEGLSQMEVLSVVNKKNPHARVIFMSEEGNYKAAKTLIDAGADDVVSKDYIRPRGLARSVETVLQIPREQPQSLSEPIICEVVDGKVLKIGEDRLERVRETMGIFSETFDRHQRHTRHYAVMNAILTSYPEHLGNSIVDLGCGTGHPMRQLSRHVFVPEFAADPPHRSKTRIISVDNTVKMLLRAKEGFGRLYAQHNEILSGNLEMDFLQADFMSLDRGVLADKGFSKVDTVLASYIIHWTNDKEGLVRKFGELLDRGGKLVSVEEWPPIVTPGPHMPMALAKLIEANIMPIELDKYYEMMESSGLRYVTGSRVIIRIDRHHCMYGRVFEKSKMD